MKTKSKKITTIKDLTADLVSNYEKLGKNQITTIKAKEISNMAGKIINAAKVNLEYNSYMKFRRRIAFLDVK